jgi:hypothetical protein
MVEFKICLAKIEDIEILVRYRLNMWLDIAPEHKQQIQESKELTHRWIKKKVTEGTHIGFIARTQTDIVAGSGLLWIREEQPRFTNTCLQAPYLMSMYTEKAFRRRGSQVKSLKALSIGAENIVTTQYIFTLLRQAFHCMQPSASKLQQK